MKINFIKLCESKFDAGRGRRDTKGTDHSPKGATLLSNLYVTVEERAPALRSKISSTSGIYLLGGEGGQRLILPKLIKVTLRKRLTI